MKRKLGMAGATLLLAAATGHLMQSGENSLAERVTMKAQAAKPVEVVSLAAVTDAAPSLPQSPVTPVLPALAARPVAAPEMTAAIVLPEAQEAPLPLIASCDQKLDLVAQPSAMIGLSLSAPCQPNERVVVRHGGLAITGLTSATGALFLSLPAMQADAAVAALFPGGAQVEASLELPEARDFRRFAVQWQGDDAFQIHAFENGADYGQPGHVSAAKAQLAAVGAAQGGGFMTVLGDARSDRPMLAEVYTFPADASDVRVVVEAAVTAKTCGREILGETLTNGSGDLVSTDLTFAMPGCDGVGDYLVLNHFLPELKFAAAD